MYIYRYIFRYTYIISCIYIHIYIYEFFVFSQHEEASSCKNVWGERREESERRRESKPEHGRARLVETYRGTSLPGKRNPLGSITVGLCLGS